MDDNERNALVLVLLGLLAYLAATALFPPQPAAVPGGAQPAGGGGGAIATAPQPAGGGQALPGAAPGSQPAGSQPPAAGTPPAAAGTPGAAGWVGGPGGGQPDDSGAAGWVAGPGGGLSTPGGVIAPGAGAGTPGASTIPGFTEIPGDPQPAPAPPPLGKAPTECSICEDVGNLDETAMFVTEIPDQAYTVALIYKHIGAGGFEQREPVEYSPIVMYILQKNQPERKSVQLLYTDSRGRAEFRFAPKYTDGCYEYRFLYCHDAGPSCKFTQCMAGIGIDAAESGFASVGNIPLAAGNTRPDPNTNPPDPMVGRLQPTATTVTYCPPPPVIGDSAPPFCLPIALILALLGGALYLSGRNPLAGFDLTTPRLHKPVQYAARGRSVSIDIQAIGSAVASIAQAAGGEGKADKEGKALGDKKVAAAKADAKKTGKKFTPAQEKQVRRLAMIEVKNRIFGSGQQQSAGAIRQGATVIESRGGFGSLIGAIRGIQNVVGIAKDAKAKKQGVGSALNIAFGGSAGFKATTAGGKFKEWVSSFFRNLLTAFMPWLKPFFAEGMQSVSFLYKLALVISQLLSYTSLGTFIRIVDNYLKLIPGVESALGDKSFVDWLIMQMMFASPTLQASLREMERTLRAQELVHTDAGDFLVRHNRATGKFEVLLAGTIRTGQGIFTVQIDEKMGIVIRDAKGAAISGAALSRLPKEVGVIVASVLAQIVPAYNRVVARVSEDLAKEGKVLSGQHRDIARQLQEVMGWLSDKKVMAVLEGVLKETKDPNVKALLETILQGKPGSEELQRLKDYNRQEREEIRAIGTKPPAAQVEAIRREYAELRESVIMEAKASAFLALLNEPAAVQIVQKLAASEGGRAALSRGLEGAVRALGRQAQELAAREKELVVEGGRLAREKHGLDEALQEQKLQVQIMGERTGAIWSLFVAPAQTHWAAREEELKGDSEAVATAMDKKAEDAKRLKAVVGLARDGETAKALSKAGVDVAEARQLLARADVQGLTLQTLDHARPAGLAESEGRPGDRMGARERKSWEADVAALMKVLDGKKAQEYLTGELASRDALSGALRTLSTDRLDARWTARLEALQGQMGQEIQQLRTEALAQGRSEESLKTDERVRAGEQEIRQKYGKLETQLTQAAQVDALVLLLGDKREGAAFRDALGKDEGMRQAFGSGVAALMKTGQKELGETVASRNELMQAQQRVLNDIYHAIANEEASLNERKEQLDGRLSASLIAHELSGSDMREYFGLLEEATSGGTGRKAKLNMLYGKLASGDTSDEERLKAFVQVHELEGLTRGSPEVLGLVKGGEGKASLTQLETRIAATIDRIDTLYQREGDYKEQTAALSRVFASLEIKTGDETLAAAVNAWRGGALADKHQQRLDDERVVRDHELKRLDGEREGELRAARERKASATDIETIETKYSILKAQAGQQYTTAEKAIRLDARTEALPLLLARPETKAAFNQALGTNEPLAHIALEWVAASLDKGGPGDARKAVLSWTDDGAVTGQLKARAMQLEKEEGRPDLIHVYKQLAGGRLNAEEKVEAWALLLQSHSEVQALGTMLGRSETVRETLAAGLTASAAPMQEQWKKISGQAGSVDAAMTVLTGAGAREYLGQLAMASDRPPVQLALRQLSDAATAPEQRRIALDVALADEDAGKKMEQQFGGKLVQELRQCQESWQALRKDAAALNERKAEADGQMQEWAQRAMALEQRTQRAEDNLRLLVDAVRSEPFRAYFQEQESKSGDKASREICRVLAAPESAPGQVMDALGKLLTDPKQAGASGPFVQALLGQEPMLAATLQMVRGQGQQLEAERMTMEQQADVLGARSKTLEGKEQQLGEARGQLATLREQLATGALHSLNTDAVREHLARQNLERQATQPLTAAEAVRFGEATAFLVNGEPAAGSEYATRLDSLKKEMTGRALLLDKEEARKVEEVHKIEEVRKAMAGEPQKAGVGGDGEEAIAAIRNSYRQQRAELKEEEQGRTSQIYTEARVATIGTLLSGREDMQALLLQAGTKNEFAKAAGDILAAGLHGISGQAEMVMAQEKALSTNRPALSDLQRNAEELRQTGKIIEANGTSSRSLDAANELIRQVAALDNSRVQGALAREGQTIQDANGIALKDVGHAPEAVQDAVARQTERLAGAYNALSVAIAEQLPRMQAQYGKHQETQENAERTLLEDIRQNSPIIRNAAQGAHLADEEYVRSSQAALLIEKDRLPERYAQEIETSTMQEKAALAQAGPDAGKDALQEIRKKYEERRNELMGMARLDATMNMMGLERTGAWLRDTVGAETADRLEELGSRLKKLEEERERLPATGAQVEERRTAIETEERSLYRQWKAVEGGVQPVLKDPEFRAQMIDEVARIGERAGDYRQLQQWAQKPDSVPRENIVDTLARITREPEDRKEMGRLVLGITEEPGQAPMQQRMLEDVTRNVRQLREVYAIGRADDNAIQLGAEAQQQAGRMARALEDVAFRLREGRGDENTLHVLDQAVGGYQEIFAAQGAAMMIGQAQRSEAGRRIGKLESDPDDSKPDYMAKEWEATRAALERQYQLFEARTSHAVAAAEFQASGMGTRTMEGLERLAGMATVGIMGTEASNAAQAELRELGDLANQARKIGATGQLKPFMEEYVRVGGEQRVKHQQDLAVFLEAAKTVLTSPAGSGVQGAPGALPETGQMKALTDALHRYQASGSTPIERRKAVETAVMSQQEAEEKYRRQLGGGGAKWRYEER